MIFDTATGAQVKRLSLSGAAGPDSSRSPKLGTQSVTASTSSRSCSGAELIQRSFAPNVAVFASQSLVIRMARSL